MVQAREVMHGSGTHSKQGTELSVAHIRLAGLFQVVCGVHVAEWLPWGHTVPGWASRIRDG